MRAFNPAQNFYAAKLCYNQGAIYMDNSTYSKQINPVQGSDNSPQITFPTYQPKKKIRLANLLTDCSEVPPASITLGICPTCLTTGLPLLLPLTPLP